MQYIAHRGFSLEYEDNSIEAIHEAIARGYDGVEIDVQLCKTGEIVLFHDVYTNGRFISDLSLDELHQLGICSIEEVYERVPGLQETLLLVDIKGADSRIGSTLELFYAYRSVDKVIFCSFNRKILSNLPTRFKKGTTLETTFCCSEYSTIVAGMTAVLLHWTCLDHDLVSHCKNNGIVVYTYTFKETEEYSYMCKYAVDGVITNGLCAGNRPYT
jgi:glycerophosphoryl diester phosphodiesterase